MTQTKRIEIALLIIRLTAALFLGLWASLKFHRPEWTQNIFKGAYRLKELGLETLPVEISYTLGGLQLAIVFAFAIGLWRTWTYGLMMAMSAAGVLGSLGSLMTYYDYPRNLMLTSIPTLGALIALFLLRDLDNLLSVSGRRVSSSKAPGTKAQG